MPRCSRELTNTHTETSWLSSRPGSSPKGAETTIKDSLENTEVDARGFWEDIGADAKESRENTAADAKDPSGNIAADAKASWKA